MPRRKREEHKPGRSLKPIKIDDPRNYTIRKASDLIQEGRFALSKNEFKALNFIISLIKKTDTIGTVYTFDCRKFLNTLGYREDSNLSEARVIIESLARQRWWIQDKETGKWVLAGWIDLAETDSDSRNMSLTFHSTVAPYIFDLENKDTHKYITRYKYGYINQMQKEYSPRLYELLKSYANNDEWIFEFNTNTERDICVILAKTEMDAKTQKKTVYIPKNWSKYSLFKRDVLEPAKEEINKFSDIRIDYEPLKYDLSGVKHRGTASIRFMISQVKVDMTKEEIKIVDEPKQMSFADVFPEANEAEQSRQIDEYRKAKDEAIEKSAYPSVMDILYGSASEAQVIVLVEMLQEKIPPDRIPRQFIDPWACDIINHYWRKICVTPERTKSTAYLRLMSEITYDNDNKVNEHSRWEKDN